MPEYSFKATDMHGRISHGIRTARDIDDLEFRLQQGGLELLSGKEVQQGRLFTFLRSLRVGRVKRSELIEFSNNMKVMLAAGVPLVDAMMELRSDQSNRYFDKVLESLIEGVQSGESLHRAMAKWRRVFPSLYTNIIEIGENTGKLDSVFGELVTHYKRIEDLKKNARKAMIYPTFVLFTLVLVAIVFLGKVFPIIFRMFEEFEIKKLPAITEFFLDLSHLIQTGWYYIIGCIILFLVLIFILRRIRFSRYYFDWLEINTPFFKAFFQELRMAFFARYLATLQKSGVDILKSLELAAGSINNMVLQKIMDRCREDVLAGKHLSESLRSNSRLVPNMVIRMIAVGEAAGTLPEQLEFVASYYDERLERRIAIFLALLEPILIVLLAGIGLALVMAILMPMYEFLGQLFSNY